MFGYFILDMKNAFFLADQRYLLSKISVSLNCSNSLPFLRSYLNNGVQRVSIHGSYSSEETAKYSVPQGSDFFSTSILMTYL